MLRNFFRFLGLTPRVASSTKKSTNLKEKVPREGRDPGPVREAIGAVVGTHGCGEIRAARVCEKHKKEPFADDYFEGFYFGEGELQELNACHKGWECQYCGKSYKIRSWNGKKFWFPTPQTEEEVEK